jgi:nucleotide-binding universal stress UspA family protein
MKILIPVDFTELSDFALGIVKNLAQFVSLDVHFVHVMKAPDDAMKGDHGCMQIAKDDQYLVDEARSKTMSQISEWIKDVGCAYHVEVRAGDITKNLIRYTNLHEIDMIVMGTDGTVGHHQSALRKTSKAAELTRTSEVPVLSLKCDRSQMSLGNLLLITDLKDPKEHRMQLIKNLQKAFNATIHLGCVITPKNFLTTNEIDAKIASFIQKNGLKKVETHVLLDNTMESGVLHLSSKLNIDLIVIGTEAKTGWKYLFADKSVEDIVNHLFKPVITYHI